MIYDFHAQKSLDWLADAFNEQDKRRYMAQWRTHFLSGDEKLLVGMRFYPEPSQLDRLPLYAFQISITFRLKTPYLSRDETDFYLLDHPVRKEKVFKTPMVAASSWKGALRAALGKLDPPPSAVAIDRILGSVREDEDTGQVGRLYAYPTFFLNATPALEIINPHERDSGVGTVPISFESAPVNSRGEWHMVYLPPPAMTAAVVAEDLAWIAKGMYAVLAQQGIGAKTSSGYGLAASGSGSIAIHKQLSQIAMPTNASPPIPEGLARYLKAPGVLADEFRQADGSIVEEATYRQRVEKSGRQYKKPDKLLYNKALKWWQAESQSSSETSETDEAPPTSPITILPFNSLEDLPTLAETLAAQINEGGA